MEGSKGKKDLGWPRGLSFLFFFLSYSEATPSLYVSPVSRARHLLVTARDEQNFQNKTWKLFQDPR